MIAGPLLVTGASGFVGRHVLARIAHDHPDWIVATPDTDITDRDAVDALIADLRPACCLHLAAIAAIGVARDAPDRAWSVNLHGTLNVAGAIRRHVPGCRLIFVSSADLYGASFRSGLPLDEDAVLAPLNTYGATKAAADLAMGAMAAEGLNILRVRAFNHTGPGQSADFAVPAFARQIARAEAGLAPPVLRTGALAPQRDFLDVRDVAQAYVNMIAHGEAIPTGTILNIASGTPRRIGDILSDLTAQARVSLSVEEDAGRLRPTDIPRAAGNAARAHAALQWKPEIPWAQTLSDVLEDWRERVRQGAD